MANEEELLELYTEYKRQTLEELQLVLVKDIEPKRLYAFLRSNGIFDEDDQDVIESDRAPRRVRAERFIDILSKKGDKGFNAFCQCILQTLTGQLHLLKKILKVFEEKVQGTEELQHTRQISRVRALPELPCPGQIGGPELPEGYYSLYTSEPPPPYTIFDSICQ